MRISQKTCSYKIILYLLFFGIGSTNSDALAVALQPLLVGDGVVVLGDGGGVPALKEKHLASGEEFDHGLPDVGTNVVAISVVKK